jgi:hypothetical protein
MNVKPMIIQLMDMCAFKHLHIDTDTDPGQANQQHQQHPPSGLAPAIVQNHRSGAMDVIESARWDVLGDR